MGGVTHVRRAFPLIPVAVLLTACAVAGALYLGRAYLKQPDRDDSFRTLHVGRDLLCVAYDTTGRFVAAGGWDYGATIWDATTGRELHTLKGHTDRVYSIAFTPDGRRLATGSKDRTTRIWNTETGEQLQILRGHQDRVMELAYSPDGRWLATGSRDRTLKIWNADRYTEVRAIRTAGSWPQRETIRRSSSGT